MKRISVWKQLHLNNKGLTLLEAVVAITLIAIVSVGITSLVFSLSKISKMSEEQLKVNAVIRVVKENAVKSIRSLGDNIYGTTINLSEDDDPGEKYENIPIIDVSGQAYPYIFDLTYKSKTNGVRNYIITIKKGTSGPVVTELSIEVYTGMG